ncbi:MAG TPA: hypothetical protein VIV11_39275 [Kofleriaceae bacterium]
MRHALVLVAALASGCGDNDDFDDDVDVDIDENDDGDDGDDPPPPGVLRWTATITGYANYGTIAGVANVQMTNGAALFLATVSLNSDIPGSVRPWHVHDGTCNSGGDIIGDDGDYPRLIIDNAGTAAGEAVVDVGLVSGEAYHVNIHESDAQFTTLIACGDLVRL